MIVYTLQTWAFRAFFPTAPSAIDTRTTFLVVSCAATITSLTIRSGSIVEALVAIQCFASVVRTTSYNSWVNARFRAGCNNTTPAINSKVTSVVPGYATIAKSIVRARAILLAPEPVCQRRTAICPSTAVACWKIAVIRANVLGGCGCSGAGGCSGRAANPTRGCGGCRGVLIDALRVPTNEVKSRVIAISTSCGRSPLAVCITTPALGVFIAREIFVALARLFAAHPGLNTFVDW
mmetsp:Transcript_12816/g.23565  ORF Transcript_12816/g.23565 Transcript_12816/m.23565 type:complete len:236 (-) Transcript_12816:407-1114(-)